MVMGLGPHGAALSWMQLALTLRAAHSARRSGDETTVRFMKQKLSDEPPSLDVPLKASRSVRRSCTTTPATRHKHT